MSSSRIGASSIIIALKHSRIKGVNQDKLVILQKIAAAKKACISEDFFIIARIESFILGKTLNDALTRAEAYSKAGADAILIHSKEKTPKQIFDFAKRFRKSKFYKPMVCVPSTYSHIHENELIKMDLK